MNKIALGDVFVLSCILVAVASAIIVSSQPSNNSFSQDQTQSSSPTPTQTYNPTNPSSNQPPWAEPPTVTTISGSLPILFSARILNFTIEYSNTTHEGTDLLGRNHTWYPQNVYPVTVFVGLTYLGKPQDAPWDMLIESFNVKVTSDTGLSASYTAVMGTNMKETTTHAHDPGLPSMYMGVSIVRFYMNMTEGHQAALQMGDDLYGTNPGNSGLWQKGPPNTITVTLLRGDWTANDNGHFLTIVNPEKETAVQTLTLQRTGNGVSYFASS